MTLLCLLQIFSSVLFKLLPYRIGRALLVKELFQIAVQRAHLADCVHGVVGGAELAEARRAHELEEAQAGLAVGRALKVLIVIREYLMPGVSYGAVALDVGVDKPVQICRVVLYLFQIAVGLVARESHGNYERRMAQEIIAHVRLVDDLEFHAVKYLSDELLI